MYRYFSTDARVRVVLISPPQLGHFHASGGRLMVSPHALHLNAWVAYFLAFPIMSLIRWVRLMDSTTSRVDTASISEATSTCFEIFSLRVRSVE